MLFNMRRLSRYIKGDELKILLREGSWVRIPPLALIFWDIGIFKKVYAIEKK